MFHNLGVQWGASLLAFFAALLSPVPALLYIYGDRIRAKSRFALDDASSLPASLPEKPEGDTGAVRGSSSMGRTNSYSRQVSRDLERILSGEDNWIGTTTSTVDDHQPENLSLWLSRLHPSQSRRLPSDSVVPNSRIHMDSDMI